MHILPKHSFRVQPFSFFENLQLERLGIHALQSMDESDSTSKRYVSHSLIHISLNINFLRVRMNLYHNDINYKRDHFDG